MTDLNTYLIENGAPISLSDPAVAAERAALIGADFREFLVCKGWELVMAPEIRQVKVKGSPLAVEVFSARRDGGNATEFTVLPARRLGCMALPREGAETIWDEYLSWCARTERELQPL